MPFVLASKSKARHLLLSNAGLDIICDPASVDEKAIKSEMLTAGKSVEDVSIVLAEAKALEVAQRHPDNYIIGGDQMLECEGVWFDKPKTKVNAIEHLKKLRGKTHYLHSAVTVAQNTEILWSQTQSARLTMRDFDDQYIMEYLEKSDESILSSVGCYHLEGLGAQLFETVEGGKSVV